MGSKVKKVQYTLNPCREALPFSEIKVILRCADQIIARGGRSLLTKILKGSKDKKVLEWELEKTPGYGFFKELSVEAVTSKIDWCINQNYLEIFYDYRLPVICFTDKGWDIEKDTYSDELFFKLEEITMTEDFNFIDTLKDRNRGMIFLLLEKIRKTKDKSFILLLEYWKTIDYKKVRAKIDWVIRGIEED